MEANRISLSNFPAFSLTGDPGFNFRGKPIHITEVLAVSQNSLFHFSILARSSRDGNDFFSNPCNWHVTFSMWDRPYRKLRVKYEQNFRCGLLWHIYLWNHWHQSIDNKRRCYQIL
jgi:hypothetical protein